MRTPDIARRASRFIALVAAGVVILTLAGLGLGQLGDEARTPASDPGTTVAEVAEAANEVQPEPQVESPPSTGQAALIVPQLSRDD